LRGYIFALLAEGQLSGSQSPKEVAKRVIALVGEDLPAVMGDLAQHIFNQASARLSSAVKAKMDKIAADLGTRGFRAVWEDLMEQYSRGMSEVRR